MKYYIFFLISFFIYFYKYCNTNTIQNITSYSANDSNQIPIDHKLIKIMNYKKNGIFIETGANDGIRSSNTKLLEVFFGWNGILIEPSNNLFSILCTNRPNSKCFSCALGSFEENGKYLHGDFDGHLMSSFTNRLGRPTNTKVFVRSLQSILDELQITHINFFSLDTEGYELNILNGIDFNKVKFDYILIEIYKHQFEKIISFLLSKDYELICCISNYNLNSNPNWDGTHNDYLFKRKNLKD